MLPLQNVEKIDYSTYLRGTLLFGEMRFLGKKKHARPSSNNI